MKNLSNPVKTGLRTLSFLVATLLVWGGYFYWRPPAPMLFLHHDMHLPEWSNEVSMTFDDGPHPLTTPLLLAALRRADVRATFFAVGNGLTYYPQLAQRIRQEGHTLANHSENHRNLTTISPAEYPDEIDKCFSAIAKTGEQTRLFRPPGGGLDRDALNYLYKNNITLAWWSNNVGDWAPLPAWKIAYHVNAAMRPGDIILLHDAGTSTPQAVPAIVREARKRGLRFVPLP